MSRHLSRHRKSRGRLYGRLRSPNWPHSHATLLRGTGVRQNYRTRRRHQSRQSRQSRRLYGRRRRAHGSHSHATLLMGAGVRHQNYRTHVTAVCDRGPERARTASGMQDSRTSPSIRHGLRRVRTFHTTKQEIVIRRVTHPQLRLLGKGRPSGRRRSLRCIIRMRMIYV